MRTAFLAISLVFLVCVSEEIISRRGANRGEAHGGDDVVSSSSLLRFLILETNQERIEQSFFFAKYVYMKQSSFRFLFCAYSDNMFVIEECVNFLIGRTNMDTL